MNHFRLSRRDVESTRIGIWVIGGTHDTYPEGMLKLRSGKSGVYIEKLSRRDVESSARSLHTSRTYPNGMLTYIVAKNGNYVLNLLDFAKYCQIC